MLPQSIACRRARVPVSRPVTRYPQLRGSFFSPQWVGRTIRFVEEIAALIVLIKRPAVAPNSEQPLTTDFGLALLSLSMSVHGIRGVKGGSLEQSESLHRVSSSCFALDK
jgi:hypothetical protein